MEADAGATAAHTKRGLRMDSLYDSTQDWVCQRVSGFNVFWDPSAVPGLEYAQFDRESDSEKADELESLIKKVDIEMRNEATDTQRSFKAKIEKLGKLEVGQAGAGCFAALSSFFRTKRKDRSPVEIHPSDETSSPHHCGIETLRPESSLAAADVPRTTDCSDIPEPLIPTVENRDPNHTQENDLWQAAFEMIGEKEKEQIRGDFGQFGNENPVQGLIYTVKEHTARFEEESAKIKVGGRVIIWRDYAARVVSGLTVLGDIAIQFAPAPSSVIWSALTVLLKTHVNECESLAAMMGCVTQVLLLVRCSAIYEKVYLTDIPYESSQAASHLREALINLYSKILLLLARAKNDLNKSNSKRFLHALLNGGEGENLIQDMDKAEKQVELARQACEAVQTQRHNTEARKLLQTLDKPLRHIDNAVEAILEEVLVDKRAKMLNSFSAVAFGDQHLRRTKLRTEGTGKWLLKHPKFYNWETSSSSSILWLAGEMGTGKSLLTSNVIDRYWAKDTSPGERINEGFAFFYYSKNDRELKGDPLAHILGSFLRQLATVPHYPKHMYTCLVELHDLMEERKITLDIERYKQILLQLTNLLPRTFLVLDGLDEFEKKTDVADIVGYFVELVEKSDRPIKVFISSRWRPYISNKLIKAKHNFSQLVLSNENQADIEKFVQQFTRGRAEEIGLSWDTELKNEVETTLCAKARGMFRWVYLQTEVLSTIDSPEEVRERLKRLPRGLEEAYDELYNAKTGRDQALLRQAVKWVMHARDPLFTQNLLSAVQLGETSENGELRLDIGSRLNELALENICRHLIVKDPIHIWRFAHASVGEYFIEKHEFWSGGKAQSELAKLSLLLLTEAFGNWSLPESYIEAKTLITGAWRDNLAQDPIISLRTYAAQHWLWHIKALGDGDAECETISKLLKRFMTAPDNLGRSSLAYENWARYTMLKLGILTGITPTSNPAFGIVVLDLHILTKQWGEECLKQSLTHINQSGEDLLSLAAQCGNSELCVKLVKLGADVNRILPSQSAALLEAIRGGYTACASKLLESGADPNIDTESRPLCRAIWGNRHQTEFCGLLLGYGANPDTPCANCPYDYAIRAAAENHNPDVMPVLIEAGANVDVRVCHYGSLLAEAAHDGALESAELLVKYGANVNIDLESSEYGGVLAAAFCGRGGLKMITYLIEQAGADPHRLISDLLAKKPLISDTSREKSREDIAKQFLDRGYMTREQFLELNENFTVFSTDFRSSLMQEQRLAEIKGLMGQRAEDPQIKTNEETRD
ncbi:hypothetical protein NUW58_g3928 [Xylaria curta]|uniref:Uncharacterized protein n=1 Tax=Xylaria curta TaxID=42375 RepID=A0ACC1P9M1_9PEZI|nr:hypothetical protein NUW58_g3928 [Xylaria curta]